MGVKRTARQRSERRSSTRATVLSERRRGPEDAASPWHLVNVIPTMFLENINRQEDQLARDKWTWWETQTRATDLI